jgi:diadenosine tetraphosphate (Ap4A) HIT family hydrolase
VSEYEPFDLASYFERIKSSPCFICGILEGRDTSHHIIYRNDTAIVFLSKYPPLYGYTLVAPVQHKEQVTGDFTGEEYRQLQDVVYRATEAIRQELPNERIYILSLGSQQGNSHVHWHVVALPPGVPLEQQQFEALMLTGKGYLKLPEAEMAELAHRLGRRMAEGDRTVANDGK